MNSGTFKLWNVTIFTAVVLLASLALVPAPVQAHDGADGSYFSSLASPKVINSTTPTVLTSVQVNLGTANFHLCVVVASARVFGSAPGSWDFGLQKNATSDFVTGSKRLMVATSSNLLGSVSTNYAFKSLAGTFTFYFLARRNNGATPNASVDNATITVNCFDSQL